MGDRAVEGHARAPARQQDLTTGRCQPVEVDQVGHEQHGWQVLGQVEHPLRLVQQLRRLGWHHLEHVDDDRVRVEQEADVVVAALDDHAAGRGMVTGDAGQLRRDPGVDVGAAHVDRLAGEREHGDLDGGREQRPAIGQLHLDQRVLAGVAGDDEAGPPVALATLEVRVERGLGERDVDVGHRHLAVRAGHQVGHPFALRTGP